jgi:hypothetical protein
MPRADPPQQLLERLGTLVRAILVLKSGMSLAADDPRHDNLDALELMQEVMAQLWERSADDAGATVTDLTADAATVTHNVLCAWSKRSPPADIARAKEHWLDRKERQR